MQNLCFDVYLDDCRSFRRESRQFKIPFEQICNGIVEHEPDLDGNTDESDCDLDEWPCHTYVRTCNNIWNCPNGEDELGCGKPNLASRHCNKTTHFCLDANTGFPICLSERKVNDGILNCVGSVDERSFCRIKYPYEKVRRYRCKNSDQCISPFQVCDCHQDCPLNDDETIACIWFNNGQEPWCDSSTLRCRNGKIVDYPLLNSRCDGMNFHCTDGEDELFCELIDEIFSESISLINMEEYPNRLRSASNNFLAFYCNRGLYVYSSESPSGFICLCPTHYYGDRCQYQRKRLTLIFQVQIIGPFNHLSPTLKFVILLVRQNETKSILSHEEFLYIPFEYCLPKYITHLAYPVEDSLSLSLNDSIEIHLFTGLTLEYKTSWIYSVPFNFLPVQQIVKRLFLSANDIISQSVSLTISKNKSNLCSNNSVYLGYDRNLDRDICVCPITHIGSRCLIPYDPCDKNSCNNHGECIQNDERSNKYQCICDLNWFGDRCERIKFRINVFFSKDSIVLSSSIAFVHLIIAQKYRDALHLTSFNRLEENLFNSTFYFEYDMDENQFHGLIVFLRLFEDLDHVNYYLLSLKQELNETSKEIISTANQSNRCQSINELFNKTIRKQMYMRRIKNYQTICLKKNFQNQLTCFYDEQMICLCDKTNHLNCFNLYLNENGCPWNKCSNRGICVENHYLCPTSSICICRKCYYGSSCQFSSNTYLISLDSILASHIQPNITSLFQQTKLIQISFIIMLIVIMIGIILNLLSIGTFLDKTTQGTGSGLYLLTSSCFALFTFVFLMIKLFLLLYHRQNNLSCSFIEYFLKFSSTNNEWLNTCVAIERTWAVKKKARFSRVISKKLSKWIIFILITLISLICLPELIYRRMIIDQEDKRTWCILTLNYEQQAILFRFYVISNVLLFLLPTVINLISSIIIIIITFRFKQQLNSTIITDMDKKSQEKLRSKTLRKQIMKHKHILLSGIILGCFSLPRIISIFKSICTKLDKRLHLSLFTYLIGFIPSMSIFVAFILPSDAYRAALILFIKKLFFIRLRF
ncbi:unnamed protein product [Adineta ricciae]|uniref:EGF-like domain-containing protein n=1 Tax=Adineta ricciae TaxID=249248 RepID=A0A814MQ21_ADIRI|nr:unnamed protein product [Adineta ricciae]